MIRTKDWIDENVDYLFDYALGYMSNTGITEPSPKFHMLDSIGRIAVISCEFWCKDDEHTKEDYEEFGALLDNLQETYGAVASLLSFIGEKDGKPAICILSSGKGVEPTLHYKEIIWQSMAEFIDFTKTTSIPWKKVRNLKY